MNIINVEGKYLIIFDDTTELKKNNGVSEYTASISILEFNPQS